MIEREFDLETTPEIQRYYLHNSFNGIKHIVTMADLEEAFKDKPDELSRISNNKSSVWFLEKIY